MPRTNRRLSQCAICGVTDHTVHSVSQETPDGRHTMLMCSKCVTRDFGIPDVGQRPPATRLMDQQTGLQEADLLIEAPEIGRIGEGLDQGGPHRQVEHALGPIARRSARRQVEVALLLRIVGEQRRIDVVRKHARRWRNEGLFCTYKRRLAKAKLQSRTVRLAHREAETSMLALALLMAAAAQAVRGGAATVLIQGSPRRVLLRIRGAMQTDLRRLGPVQWQQYQIALERVRDEQRERHSSKVRQHWPRRSEHKPPKPPKIRVMDDKLKALAEKALGAAAGRTC